MTTTATRRVERISIRSILGIDELVIDKPGAVTVISGGNGVGKSSVLAAIQAAIGGGHEATLVRQGSDEGEVVLVLEDGTEITKRVRAESSNLAVRHPEFGKIGSPQSWLNGIVDGLSLDPAAFLAASAAERVRMLMEAWPVKVTVAQLREALGPVALDATQGFSMDESDHALDTLARAHRSVFVERTAVNRVVKDKRATAEQLGLEIPAESDDDGMLEEALGEAKAAVSLRAYELEQALGGIREQLDASLDAIRGEAQAEIDRIIRDRDVAMTAAREATAARERATRKTLEPEVAAAQALAVSLEERRRHAAAHAQTRATIGRMNAEADDADQVARELTGALERLHALRESLAASIPLPGLSIEDGQLIVDGLPFDRLNHAWQIEVAVKLAAARAGELGIVCVDGLEALDPDTWQALLDGLEQAGLQAFVTRVTEGPLTIAGAA